MPYTLFGEWFFSWQFNSTAKRQLGQLLSELTDLFFAIGYFATGPFHIRMEPRGYCYSVRFWLFSCGIYPALWWWGYEGGVTPSLLWKNDYGSHQNIIRESSIRTALWFGRAPVKEGFWLYGGCRSGEFPDFVGCVKHWNSIWAEVSIWLRNAVEYLSMTLYNR